MHRLSFAVAAALSMPAHAGSPFPPTMHPPPGNGRAHRMVPPPHSGAAGAAPERRGGIAAMRRWAGVLSSGQRADGASH